MTHLPAWVLSIHTVKTLRYTLDQMIPSGVEAFADSITDQEESFEYPEEEAALVNAVQKRRNEFIVGRRCARAALAKISVKPCVLIPREDRVPQWPIGVIGSISHSVDLCCAVVTHANKIACLGVDLETTTRISSGVTERVLHPLETDYVGNDKARSSLLFSAKEAFFKAQFPVWNTWPNFSDLAFQVDETSSGRLEVIHVAPHLPKDLRMAAKRMQFRYAFLDDYVVTLCWMDPC